MYNIGLQKIHYESLDSNQIVKKIILTFHVVCLALSRRQVKALICTVEHLPQLVSTVYHVNYDVIELLIKSSAGNFNLPS